MLKIKVINKSSNPLPVFGTIHSAGVDLRAFISEPIVLKSLQRVLVPTGLFIELPDGCEAQIRPRSGLALKHGLTVLNSPGTIDSDYRGEIKVILVNLSESDFIINNGERICQMVVSKYEKFQWTLTDNLDESHRGEGGFGHTGVH